ncbi:MAG TPA: DsrE/DsrF/DrsH-like family protein [Acidimicrobiia bacterium]|nr:DsrE/DsrF/DrsH-like family protein [Acidimicrobiia bacterium]
MTTDSGGFITPQFDADQGRKLAIICSKGTLDMAYPGLIIGNGAAQEGIETHLFFTFWGMDIIRRKTVNKLTMTPAGNTAMRIGSTSLAMPQLLGVLPGMSSMASWMMRGKIKGLDVPPVHEFLTQIADAGGHLWACKMSVDMMKLTRDDFIPEVEDIINVSAFLDLSRDGQIIFV